MSISPVSSVLARVSYELSALADSTDEFHHLAFGEDGAGTTKLGDADFVRAAQGIDHMQQLLANLSEYVGCLAMAADEGLTFDTTQALSLITLGDLRARLSDEASEEPLADNSGEADIFF